MLSCWAYTSAGRRTENQDSVSLPGVGLLADDTITSISVNLSTTPLLVAIADGVGGRPMGQWAAQTALATLESAGLDENSPQAVASVISLASRALSERVGSGAGPATTLAGFSVTKDALLRFHVGDSRIYEVKESSVRSITTDHRSRGDGRSITRYLGSDAHAIPAIAVMATPFASTYLISSDGFHEFLRESDLLLVAEIDPPLALETLFSQALENGSDDNLSAVIVRIDV